jgi:aminoglycoside 3'-phosphotransferase-2
VRGIDTLELLPTSWRSELANASLEPVRSGLSGASVFRVHKTMSPDRFLKVATGTDAEQLRQEIVRTGWLGSHGVNVPPIVRTLLQPDVVAILMGALPGEPIGRSPLPPDEVVTALARALSELHSLAIKSCPFEESLAVRLARAQSAISQGKVEPAEFDERNSGLTPEGLFQRVIDTIPRTEDTVVAHGDATFSNILIGAQERVGFIDCGHSGTADRYVDLVLITSEIEHHYGKRWVSVFFRRYGQTQLDCSKARSFLDLYEFF